MKKKTISEITPEFINEIILLYDTIDEEDDVVEFLYNKYAITDIALSERKAFFRYIIQTMESCWILNIRGK